MNHTGLDLNIVLIRTENPSASDPYKVTVADQELIQHSCYNYRSIVEGGLSAESTRDRTAVGPLAKPLVDFTEFPTNELRMVTYKISKKIRS